MRQNLRANLQRLAVDVRLNGCLIPGADLYLRVGRGRAEIVGSIAEGLANRVYANLVARIQEILVHDGAGGHRVGLHPLAVRVIRKEFRRLELLLRVAILRLLS